MYKTINSFFFFYYFWERKKKWEKKRNRKYCTLKIILNNLISRIEHSVALIQRAINSYYKQLVFTCLPLPQFFSFLFLVLASSASCF